MRQRVICAGCEGAYGFCNWRGEMFCPHCTAELVKLSRWLNELPTAQWESVEFGDWAVEHETAIVQEWVQ